MPIERVGNDVRIHPAGRLTGIVDLPGSKSLTNRYLICTALAAGRSVLHGASLSDDAQAMLAGLDQLGIRTEVRPTRHEIVVHGCNGNPVGDDVEVDVGPAGTAMRFLTALACLGFGRRRLDGSARMRQRPIGDLVAALTGLGAQIGYEGMTGYPPVTVLARGLAGGEVAFDTPPSSQFLSALLMVAPYATHDVLIRVEGELPSWPYIELTIAAMRTLGVELLEAGGQRFVVPALQRYRCGDYAIEPDASAATYFWAAAAITGGRMRVNGLTRASRQGDVRFVDVLARMGCTVHEGATSLEVAAPAGGRLVGITVDLNDMPDTVQTLAVIALFAAGPTDIGNVANLRIKETDRIAALACELTRLGARVETRADGLIIHPPAQISPAAIQTHEDHRMAMSFAVAGLAVDGLMITDAGCVSKSFPGFFEMLGRL